MSTNPPDPASPAPAMVDPSGQEAPAPDTVGVPEGQFAVQNLGAESSPPVTSTGVDGEGFTLSTEDTAQADAPASPPAGARAFTTSPPPADQLADLPAWASNETADPAAIRAIQRGTLERDDTPAQPASLDDSEAVADGDDVYIRPNDPKFGTNVSRFLEGMAARDARLGPVLERIALLDNVYLRFPSDHYVLVVEEKPQESDQPAEVPVPA